MTDMQVKYAQVLENERTNRENERIKEIEAKAKRNLADNDTLRLVGQISEGPFQFIDRLLGWQNTHNDTFAKKARAFKDVTSGIGNIVGAMGA